MDLHQKAPAQQSFNVTCRLSGKLKASGYGDVVIPVGWVFLEAGKVSSRVIERLREQGPVWDYWEEKTKWTSNFKGWYVPSWLAELVQEGTRHLEAETQEKLAKRDHWLASRQHEKEILTVWALRDPNLWHQEGVREERFDTRIAIPEGWTLLKAGDQMLTRRVNNRGCYWAYKEKRGKFLRVLGVFAPSAIIEEEYQKVQHARASQGYQRRLKKQRQRRKLQEESYRKELEDAILEYLDFAPECSELASEIAEGTVVLAAEVGSGRVARTRKLTLEEKARLAVRAYIRHNYTSYEEQLTDLGIPLEPYDFLYREVKSEAGLAVDSFLSEHRKGI